MDTAIHIASPEVSKQTAENVSTGIIHILQAGSQHHSPENVMMQALSVFRDTLSAVAGAGNTISGCNFESKEINQ